MTPYLFFLYLCAAAAGLLILGMVGIALLSLFWGLTGAAKRANENLRKG